MKKLIMVFAAGLIVTMISAASHAVPIHQSGQKISCNLHSASFRTCLSDAAEHVVKRDPAKPKATGVVIKKLPAAADGSVETIVILTPDERGAMGHADALSLELI